MWMVTFVPILSMTTRRLHDAGKSRHWRWLYFTGYGSIVVIVFLCQKSKLKNNKYKLAKKAKRTTDIIKWYEPIFGLWDIKEKF